MTLPPHPHRRTRKTGCLYGVRRSSYWGYWGLVLKVVLQLSWSHLFSLRNNNWCSTLNCQQYTVFDSPLVYSLEWKDSRFTSPFDRLILLCFVINTETANNKSLTGTGLQCLATTFLEGSSNLQQTKTVREWAEWFGLSLRVKEIILGN